MKEIVLFGAHTNTVEKECALIKNILDWKKYNIPVALATHYPVSEKIQNLVDYYIFEKETHLDSSLMVKQYYSCSAFKIVADCNRPYHAAAAMISYRNSVKLLSDRYDFMYLQDYDVVLNKPELLRIVRSFYSSPFEVFMFNWKGTPDAYATNIWFFKTEMFNKIWGDLKSVYDYHNLVELTNKHNIFIEHLAKNLIDVKNLQEFLYLFDEEQAKLLISNYSEHTADVNEVRMYLTNVSTGDAILFLVNPLEIIKKFTIQTENLITGQQETIIQPLAAYSGMYWKIINNNTHLRVTCDEMKKVYLITQNSTFNECHFEFYDGTQIFMRN